MSTDLVVQSTELVPSATLFGTDDPVESMQIAKAHADVLADVIKERELFKVIGGKAHVLVDAWTLLGSRLGVFPVLDGEVVPVEVEGVPGFRATVKVVTRQGEVVGRATAYCMRDEPTWKNRPIHALAGMAETRATSRALRKPLGFIVQLAGYNPTPAEEMPVIDAQVSAGGNTAGTRPVGPAGNIIDAAAELPPVDMADPDIPFGDAPYPDPPKPKVITRKEQVRLFAIATECGVSELDVRELVLEFTGQESTKLIPAGRVYDGIVAAIQAKAA